MHNRIRLHEYSSWHNIYTPSLHSPTYLNTKSLPSVSTKKSSGHINTLPHAKKKYSMPVRHVPVYVDPTETSAYSVFVTSNGIPDLYSPCDGCNSYRLYENTMNKGFCIATTEQVNALEEYISKKNLFEPDMLHYSDGRVLPTVMTGISQNGRLYDVGTVRISPDVARFYIRQSGGCTVRLVCFSKTQLTKPRTYRPP